MDTNRIRTELVIRRERTDIRECRATVLLLLEAVRVLTLLSYQAVAVLALPVLQPSLSYSVQVCLAQICPS